MRYYIYLDKIFLRTLFAIVDESNFNIEVVEYSVRKSVTRNNEVRLEPCIENIKDGENGCREEIKDKLSKSCRDSCVNKERVGVMYDEGNAYNIQTERKYLNIEDITNMKNIHFYHDMLKLIDEHVKDEKSRVIKEEGYIKLCNNSRFEANSKNFFMINDTFVWFDNTLLQGDIELLSQMSCRINVIGYRMNCNQVREDKIIKAIAIYLE